MKCACGLEMMDSEILYECDGGTVWIPSKRCPNHTEMNSASVDDWGVVFDALADNAIREYRTGGTIALSELPNLAPTGETTNSSAEEEIYHWSHAFDPFVEGIQKLRDHMAVCVEGSNNEGQSVEMTKFLDMYDDFLRWDEWDAGDISADDYAARYVSEDARRWNELMDYLRDHMRSWWC